MKDLRLARYRMIKEWGIGHGLAFAASGTGSGLYLASVLSQFLYRVDTTLAQLLGLGLIVVGALITFLHLTHPLTFIRYVSNFGRSWIPWGTVCLLVAVISGLVALGLNRYGDSPSYVGSGLLILAVACAVVVMLYPGLVLASTGVPFWKTFLVPLQFAAFNLVAGVGIALLLVVADGSLSELLSGLAVAMIGLLVLNILFLLVHVRVAPKSVKGILVHRILGGELSDLFLWSVIVFGLVLPIGLILASFPTSGIGKLLMVAVAMVLVLQGSVMHRLYLLRTAIRPPLI